MRQCWSMGLLAAVVLGLAGCGGSDGRTLDDWSRATAGHIPAPQSSTPPTVDELRQGIVWKGEFTIVIEVWDKCAGTGQMAMSDRYTKTESFSFATAPPLDLGPAAREANPFYANGGTDPSIGGTVNLAFQSTGTVGLPGLESDPLVVPFWELQYADGHLTGRLVDDHRELGLPWNRINDDMDVVGCQPYQGTINMPFPMKEGATLDATFEGDQLTMVIEGHSLEDERRWRVVATATRTG